jgi:excisionase family DNA binding protein
MATAPASEPFALLSEWPTEAEAAALLGCSVRSLTRYAEKGQIEMRKRPVNGRKPENVCNPSDIEKLKPRAFLLTEQPGALVKRTPDAAEFRPLVELAPTFRALMETISTAILTAQAETAGAREQGEKLVLTLKEAARTGFSVAFLRQAIEDGKLKHFRDGRRIKIVRSELVRFTEQLRK